MAKLAHRLCLFSYYEIKISSRFYVCNGGGSGVCVCVCVCMEWVVFIAIAWDETSILVAVYFSMKNIYQLCDRGRAVMWSNVGVSQ